MQGQTADADPDTDTTVASATPLSWGPGGVEIAAGIREPEQREPSAANTSLEEAEPPDETFDEFAARLRSRALMLQPRIAIFEVV